MVVSAGFKPFMEYAGSYALFNYRLEDPRLGLDYDNLRLIRAFEHGLDPKSSEAGFVLVHVDMVRNSGPLVDGVVSALDSCTSNNREEFDVGMSKVVQSMIKVNKVMESKFSTPSSERHRRLLRLTSLKQCGGRVSQETMYLSAHSSLALPVSPCSHTVWCTKVSPKSPYPSVASLEPTTAW